MDPITTAIVTALLDGVASGSTKVGQQAISDAYQAFKDLLKKKHEGKQLLKAVEDLETKPDSAGRKATLQEEVTAAKADRDPEILEAAQTLVKLLNDSPSGGQSGQTATGDYIAQADRSSSASVNVNQSK